MKVAVRYFSRSGNTKKLADAVAAAVLVAAKPVDCDLEEPVDVLLLGTSLYAGTYDVSVAAFIDRNADKIGSIVNFGSSASGKSTLPKIKAYAEAKGIPVEERMYVCPGHFLFLHKNRPNDQDLANVAEFAKSVIR